MAARYQPLTNDDGPQEFELQRARENRVRCSAVRFCAALCLATALANSVRRVQCTFENAPQASVCEMCQSSLRGEAPSVGGRGCPSRIVRSCVC
jgi:hypothetical protein